MAILFTENTRLIWQGFTGSPGMPHPDHAIAHGARRVGARRPGKGGAVHPGLAVFDMAEAKARTAAKASVISVLPRGGVGGVADAARTGVKAAKG